MLDDGEADRADCRSSAPVIEADSLDAFKKCAPRMRLRLLVHVFGGRTVSRAVRFGPIRRGGRAVLTLRLRSGVAADTVLYAIVV